MKPVTKKLEYEKVPTDNFVSAVIERIEYETDHEWKPFQGKDREPSDAVKLKFIIEGCQYPKSTPWMSFSYDARSKLYSIFINSLVEGAEEYMDFDLDQLVGMKIKMLWKDNGEYQNIETVRPVGEKVKPIANFKAPNPDDKLPF